MGQNNPFFGKTHKISTIETMKEKISLSLVAKWQNPAYRKKVIKATSKPRKASFKADQSKRVRKWYQENPGQRLLRSTKMKESWANGKIQPNRNQIVRSTSKIELRFLQDVQSHCCVDSIIKKTIHLMDGSRVIPDLFIPKQNTIVEFYGDYWHANPNFYWDPKEIVRHNLTAQEIWDKDEQREHKIRKEYALIIVWSWDYRKCRDKVLQFLSAELDWDTCSMFE
jgi:hypothetical protein